MKPNDEIRAYARERNVKLWEVAETLNMLDTTFSKQLRHEVSDERKKEILEAIDRIVINRKTA